MGEERFQWLEFEEAGAAPKAPAADQDPQQHLLGARQAYLEGDYDLALRRYSAALQRDKTLKEAWAGQVRCLTRLKEYREAQTWADKACKLFPGEPLLDSARALALAASGLTGEALASSDAALEAAEKLSLQEPHLWLERAACLLADGKAATALHCLDKVRELRPEDPDWGQRIGVELLEGGQFQRALQELQIVVDKRPQRAYPWLLLGRVYRHLRLTSRALESLDRAEQLRQNWPEVFEERRLLRRPCWIATQAFGSEDHPTVRALRLWRDRCWLKCAAGRLAAALYDRTAPAVCRWVERFPRLRPGLRRALEGLARRLERREHG